MKIWLLYSIVALVLLCAIDLVKKYILDEKMIEPDNLVVYVSIVIGIIAIVHLFLDKKCKNPGKYKPNVLLYILLIAIFVHAFNICFTRSMDLSNEVTFPVIIISLSAIVIYLVSSLFFKKSPKFNIKIFGGVLLTISGLAIVTNYMD